MHHAWQDLVLALASLVFALALVPTILGKDKPTLATSVPTAITLYVITADYITLSLWFAASTAFLSATCWAIIAVQKARQGAIMGEESAYDTKNDSGSEPKGGRR